MAGKSGLGGWIGFIGILVVVNVLSYVFGWGFTLY